MERQSDDIARRYGLIPASVSQHEMLDYLLSHEGGQYMTRSTRLSEVLKDAGPSAVSTSCLCSYMSPYTPNRRLAVLHSVGTGKTRKSMLAAMQYNRDITVVSVHSIQLTPFLMELTRGGAVDKMYPWFRKRIDSITCKSIATAVAKGDKQRLDYYFKGRVVIVDEMHHVRCNVDRSMCGQTLFDGMINVLETYEHCVVLFLTATPLVDKSSELLGMYRLLRPMSEPPGNEQLMAHGLRGYVSHYSKSNLPARGERVVCRMEEDGEQWRLYQKYQGDRSSVHSKTMAVSRFITLDDGHASECCIPTHKIVEGMIADMEVRDEAHLHELTVEALKYISVKAYKLVQHLKGHRGYPKFIFDFWKKRGGVERITDILCMPAVGYHSVTSIAEAMDRTMGPKLLALHRVASTKGSSSLIRSLIEIYNSDDNKTGDLIELLIAAPMFAESMSLRTARESHTMMTPWNVTSGLQILGRINRRTSLPYLPPEQRYVTNYTYVLYKPDGSDTIESSIGAAARGKHKSILPLLKIMAENKIELAYRDEPPEYQLDPYPGALVQRTNNMVRTGTDPIGYREVSVGVDRVLAELEKRDSIYELMGDIASQEMGYTRLVGVAIQVVEQVYIRNLRYSDITPKQQKLLKDMSPAFIEYEGYHTHVLYFSNDDTVEYQRLAKADRRIVRVLDTDLYVWVDLASKDVRKIIEARYESKITDFSSSILDKWSTHGFYVTKFLLTSCYRLVRYRTKEDLSRIKKKGNVDKRKMSRGEKWQYYNKVTLLDLLCSMTTLTQRQREFIRRKVPIDIVFDAILLRMREEGMVLELPI